MLRKGSEFPQIFWIVGVVWVVVFFAVSVMFISSGKDVSLSPEGSSGTGFYLRVLIFLAILLGVGILIWIAWKKVSKGENSIKLSK